MTPTDQMYRNRELRPYECSSAMPYLYRLLRVEARHCTLLAAHLRYLTDWHEKLWGGAVKLSEQAIDDEIFRLTYIHNRYPEKCTCAVELRLLMDGTSELRCGEISPYEQFSLRVIKPAAAVVTWQNATPGVTTSAFAAALDEARSLAMMHGAQAVIQSAPDGRLLSLDGQPLLAACGRHLYTPAGIVPSPESELAAQAARTCGYEVEAQDIFATDIAQLDELFTLDWRGVTAVGECAGHTLGDIYADRIARAVQAPF